VIPAGVTDFGTRERIEAAAEALAAAFQAEPLDEDADPVAVVDTRAAALAMTRPAVSGAQLTSHASQLGEDQPTLVVTVDTTECPEGLRVRVNVNDAPVADLVPETGLDLLET